MNILKSYEQFLNIFFEELRKINLDISNYKLDHIGYQTSSSKDYDKIATQLLIHTRLLSTKVVGGRRVGIYKLNSSLIYKGYSIDIIEIYEPRKSQNADSTWEHAEVVIDIDFKTLMNQYPNLNWDTKVINQEEFPMLRLQLAKGIKIKFPKLPVLEELKRIENSKN